MTAGIQAAGSVFPDLNTVRRRQALLQANPELQERELIKLATLATSLSQALRDRGSPAAAADLAAETGVAILRIALTRWIEDPTERPWRTHVNTTMTELHQLTAEQRMLSHSLGGASSYSSPDVG